MSDQTPSVEQLQAEILEIAEVLQREQPDKPIAELWEEALSLHRVRYETKVLPPTQSHGAKRGGNPQHSAPPRQHAKKPG